MRQIQATQRKFGTSIDFLNTKRRKISRKPVEIPPNTWLLNNFLPNTTDSREDQKRNVN